MADYISVFQSLCIILEKKDNQIRICDKFKEIRSMFYFKVREKKNAASISIIITIKR